MGASIYPIPRKAILLAKDGILLIQCAACAAERHSELDINANITDRPCVCGSNKWLYDKEAFTVGELAGHLGFFRWMKAWAKVRVQQLSQL